MNKALLFLTLIFISNPLVAQVVGCTDPLANNYNASATINNGNCQYNLTAITAARSWNLPAALDETSGLITWNNRIWTHNDDTDIHLYELDLDNINIFQKFELTGTRNIDWEEIAQDETYIYVGDFGNNSNGNRTNLYILRIEKISLLANNPLIDSIKFSYSLQTDFSPSGPNNTNFDCEAFVVSSDSIYLFTKEWVSQKTSVYSLPKVPGSYVALFKNAYNVDGLVTGATYLEDKRLLVLSGYNVLVQPFVFLLYDFKRYDFFGGNKRKIGINHPFHQVEGITTEDGLIFYISNERLSVPPITINQKLMRMNLTPFLRNYLNSLCDLPAYAGMIVGDTIVCQGQDNITYTSPLIAGATSYVWSLPQGVSGSSSTNSIILDFGIAAVSGEISVRGKNDCGAGEAASLSIVVNPLPDKPTISISEIMLTSSAVEGNQWYNEEGVLEDANQQDFAVTENGSYYVIVTLQNCSSEPSDIVHVSVTNQLEEINNITIRVYPNPTKDYIAIEVENLEDSVNFEIQNAIGQIIYKGIFKQKTVVETNSLLPGVYILKLEIGQAYQFKKFVKD